MPASCRLPFHDLHHDAVDSWGSLAIGHAVARRVDAGSRKRRAGSMVPPARRHSSRRGRTRPSAPARATSTKGRQRSPRMARRTRSAAAAAGARFGRPAPY